MTMDAAPALHDGGQAHRIWRDAARRITLDIHRDAMLLLGFIVGIGQVTGLVASPLDAATYWRAGTSTLLYPVNWSANGVPGLLFYPPPVAQISTLLQPIGWAAFDILWSTLIFGCFWYCARRWSLPLVLIALLPGPAIFSTCLGLALVGNMQWILAALVVVSLRYPSLWAVQAVTKTGPAVGALWPLVRGEWRAVRSAVLAGVAIVAISFAFAPHLWFEWIGFVARNWTLADSPLVPFPVPFALRFVTAAALIVWGARTNRRWTVAIGAGWAIPALWGFGFLPFWVGALRLRARSPGRHITMTAWKGMPPDGGGPPPPGVAQRRSSETEITLPA